MMRKREKKEKGMKRKKKVGRGQRERTERESVTESEKQSEIHRETGFPGVKVVKNPAANTGDTRDVGLISELGRSPGVGNGNPIQYSCLENSIGSGTWWFTVHRVGHN